MTEYWPAGWKVADSIDDLEAEWTAEGWGPILVPTEAIRSERTPMSEPVAQRTTTTRRREPEGRFRYREVASVREPIAMAAKATLDRASADLNLRLPRLRFFNTARSGEAVAFSKDTNIGGLARPGPWEVWVSTAIGPSEAVRTVAHEVRHLWQFQRGWPPDDQRHAIDADAERYATQFSRRYQYSPCLTACMALEKKGRAA